MFTEEHDVFYSENSRSDKYRRTCTGILKEEGSETFQFMLSDRKALASSGPKDGVEERAISKFVQPFEAQVGALCQKLVVLSDSSKMDYDKQTVSYTAPDLGEESSFPQQPLGWLLTQTSYSKKKTTVSWPRTVFVERMSYHLPDRCI